jgi:hypothetical protein
MSARTDVLLWAQRVLARKTSPPYLILEIPAGASLPDVQEAFHKIARLAHPDLHRTTLTPDELELVTTAYSRAAAAYQEIRTQRSPGARPPPREATPAPVTAMPAAGKPIATAGDRPINAVNAMSSKALIHYRKAELCLRRGELTGAVLQLKMAIASDPQSQFLRSALSEVEGELVKKP